MKTWEHEAEKEGDRGLVPTRLVEPNEPMLEEDVACGTGMGTLGIQNIKMGSSRADKVSHHCPVALGGDAEEVDLLPRCALYHSVAFPMKMQIFQCSNEDLHGRTDAEDSWLGGSAFEAYNGSHHSWDLSDDLRWCLGQARECFYGHADYLDSLN